MALSVAWASPRRWRLARTAAPSRQLSNFSLRTGLIAVLGVLTIAVGISAATAYLEHRTVADLRAVLSTRLQPAQAAGGRLASTFADQEINARAYLLTGDSASLRASNSASAASALLQKQLSGLLAANSTTRGKLDGVGAAELRWQHGAVAPELAARRHGPVSRASGRRLTQRADPLFNQVQGAVEALSAQLRADVTSQVVRLDSAQSRVDLAMMITLGLAILTTLLLATLLRHLFTAPLERLVSEVGAVSSGVYGYAITTTGRARSRSPHVRSRTCTSSCSAAPAGWSMPNAW